MVLQHFQDPHPRVKWAAINTIGQMATDFGPELQTDHHNSVLPALMFAMEDASARVQVSEWIPVYRDTPPCTIHTAYLWRILQEGVV